MSDPIKQIVRHLHTVKTIHEIAEKNNTLKTIRALQAWQCKRLIISHQDMYQQPRFKSAVEFFVDELYGPKDFSQRDKDIAKVVKKMAKLLPEKALVSLASALHLNAISFELDFDMAKQLLDKPINRESYAQAYYECNNQTTRQQQIDYIQILGGELADVVKMKGISMLLALCRKPAKLAGLLVLHEFLESGYKAFKNLGDVNDFITPVVTREQFILSQLFDPTAANPLPMNV